MTTTHIGELDFLRKLQRLLSEGDFSATLKFALLNSLADLSIEHPAARDGSLRIPLNSIAAHFIEYYWRQALPYRAPGGNASVLLQNAGKQIVAINAVDRLRSHNPTLAGARRTQRYESEQPSSWLAVTVMLDGHAIAGAWVSLTVTENEHDAELPDGSVAVQVTVVVPTGKNEPAAGEQETVVWPPQLSVPTGVA